MHSFFSVKMAVISYSTSFFFSLFICASTSYQSCAIHIYLVELVMLNVQSQCLSSHGHHHLCGFVIFNRSDKMHFFCSFWQSQRLLATYDNQIQKAPRNSEVISQHQRWEWPQFIFYIAFITILYSLFFFNFYGSSSLRLAWAATFYLSLRLIDTILWNISHNYRIRF